LVGLGKSSLLKHTIAADEEHEEKKNKDDHRIEKFW